MQFRNLKKQYEELKPKIDQALGEVLRESNYISGRQVEELEKELAAYVGVKHCVTCANGTDALTLALMVWGIKEGDAVFVPDFTFFISRDRCLRRSSSGIYRYIGRYIQYGSGQSGAGHRSGSKGRKAGAEGNRDR